MALLPCIYVCTVCVCMMLNILYHDLPVLAHDHCNLSCVDRTFPEIPLPECTWMRINSMLGLSLICLQVCLFFFPAFLLKCAQIARKCVYISHNILNKTNFSPSAAFLPTQHNRCSKEIVKCSLLCQSLYCNIMEASK